MIIAVNTRFLIKDTLEGYGYFIKEVFQILVRKHPEHSFYFLFDRPYDPEFIFGENVRPVVVGPPARHPLLWKYWYDVKIPLVLRKIKADVFISPDSICSLTTRVPQCLVLHDLGVIHRSYEYRKPHVWYYRHYIPRFLKKAKHIATVSQFSKDDIVRTYKVQPEKISVVYNAPKESFDPVGEEVKTATKERWTGGAEYFVYVGAIHPRKNLINLLKAFSIFKKRQQSGMRLVLVGRLLWKNNEFLQMVDTYKYRSDIVLTNYIAEEELHRLVASAYAMVYPSLFEGFGVPVVEAMKCLVPALTSQHSAMEEIAGEAALYFDPNSHQDIADKMMRIYKDEALRARLIQLGSERANLYSWERTAELVWKGIEEVSRKR